MQKNERSERVLTRSVFSLVLNRMLAPTASLLLMALILLTPALASAAVLFLNEFNPVPGSQFLKGGTIDADEDGGLAGDVYLGRIEGNGGDWFELVLTEGGADLRGWQLEIWVEGVLETTLVLSQDSLWTQLQAGTIITISEDQPEDVGYDPSSGDWWINVQADTGASGTYVTATSFSVNNDDWQLIIKDSAGTVVFGPAGEGVSGTGGVSSAEIFRLEENPSSFITESSLCYDDGDTYSSFGQPNEWSGGTRVQDFGPLRTGGAPTSQCDDADLTDLGFDLQNLLEIDIVMAPEDYDTLRKEQQTLMGAFGGRCGDAPAVNPYNYYPADVTVDGTTLLNVGVRSKGFFGSASRTKPSFKIDFTEYGGEQKVYGIERFTLNNLRQDPSFMDQCLGYGLYRSSGLVASRCNFAHVTLNGTSLGIYSNVESIKDPFLIRNYGDSTGNLYEGAVADFRDNWIGVFEKKNNNDVSDLEAIQAALEIEDDVASLAALSSLIDYDKFLTYWVMDGLTGNWDGYSGNSNNYWFYKNPNSGLYEFFVWSLDDLFGRDNPFFGGGSEARTVFDNSAITNRLWKIESVRLQYETRINELLATVWDEDALMLKIDQIEALISPVAGDLSGPVADTRSWIQNRAAKVASEFASGPPAYATTLGGKNCLEIKGHISSDFSTTYSDPISTNPPAGSNFSTDDLDFNGTTSVTALGAALGPAFDAGFSATTLRLIGFTSFPNGLIFNIPIHEEDIAENTPEPIAMGDSIASMVLYINFTNPQGIFPLGFVIEPQFQFDQANLVPGGTVSGTVEADLAAWVPHPVPEPSARLSVLAGLYMLVWLGRRRNRR